MAILAPQWSPSQGWLPRHRHSQCSPMLAGKLGPPWCKVETNIRIQIQIFSYKSKICRFRFKIFVPQNYFIKIFLQIQNLILCTQISDIWIWFKPIFLNLKYADSDSFRKNIRFIFALVEKLTGDARVRREKSYTFASYWKPGWWSMAATL